MLLKSGDMYPHKDIGEPLVYPSDTGTVRQSWRFSVIPSTRLVPWQAIFVVMRAREVVGLR
ncbi:hypothetical protein [Bradyrhizobium sp. USDA 10063]